MKTFNDILKIAIFPLIILVLPYVLIVLPIFWGYIPAEVTFNSMEPTYKEGELVYYKRCSSKDIGPGDLIVYDDNTVETGRIFHRAVGITEEGYVTKGDNKIHNDEYIVKYSDVVGKVQDIHLPMLGPYVKFINENHTILYVSLGAWIFFFLLNVMILSSDKKKKKKEAMAAAANEAPTQEAAPTVEVVKDETPTTVDPKEEEKRKKIEAINAANASPQVKENEGTK